MNVVRALCALALAASVPAAFAQAYKCTVNGTTTYQDKPCPRGDDSVKMDLPGAYSPPLLTSASLNGHSPQDIALGLSFNRVMVQRCNLGGTASMRLDTLAQAISPLVRAVSPSQQATLDATASKRADEIIASPNRNVACKLVDTLINVAYDQLTRASGQGNVRGGAKPSL